MRQNRIQEEWNKFRQMAINPQAGQVQITEGRRCFYAGAHAILTRILAGLDAGDEPTEKDLHMMDEIQAELEAFKESVKAGNA